MSLSPLPPAAVDEHNLQGGRLLYTHQQMKAYGQACSRQALEEVINCYSPDDTSSDWMDKIRSLKP